MAVVAIILVIAIATVLVIAVAASTSKGLPWFAVRKQRRLGDAHGAAKLEQDQDLARFLIKLHRQNREAYRRIKEAARKA